MEKIYFISLFIYYLPEYISVIRKIADEKPDVSLVICQVS